ncbi:MAG: thioredoxin [Flavobacteriaceae bacterium]|nr:thioredoxin [Flavobacteriaceae bacterium]
MSQKFQELIQSERPVLIDFFATWCQPCKVQSSVLNSVKENVGTAARIVKIDIDAYPKIATEYGVRSVPTLMVFQKGELLWRASGLHDVATLTHLLNDFAEKEE